MLGDRRGGPGLDVGGRAHLERDPLVADVRREPAELDAPVLGHGDVVDDPDAVTEPVGAAPLDRLPDRRQAERLAGVDGEVEVLALEVLERVEVPGGRVARLRAGDVEAGDPAVPPGHRERRDLHGAGRVTHRGQELAYDDPAAGRGRPLLEALLHRGHDLVERQPRRDVLLGGVADLGVDDAVRGEVLHALAGDPGEGSAGLHHRDGVVERLQVAHQRAGVRGVGEPLAQRGRVARGQLVADLRGEVQDGLRAQPTVEVVVQQDLRCPEDLVAGGDDRFRRGGRHGLILPFDQRHDGVRHARLHHP